MRFGLLGTLEVLDPSGAPVDLGGAQPRTVVAVLLVAGGQLVPTDSLIDVIWGDDPPESAPGTIQSYISRLRRAIEPARAPRDPARVLLFEPPGYRLVVDPDAIDFRRFERLADTGRALLDDGKFGEARQTLLDADALWRGPALLEYLDHEFARGLATRLEERRVAALEDRIDAELRLGRHATIVGEIVELVDRHPLREGLRAHLATALYRSGRQGDALRALDDARRTLRDELGVEPSRVLRDLERRILEHDDSLDVSAPAVLGRSMPLAGAQGDRERRGAHEGTMSAVPRLVGRRSELGQLVAAMDETAHGARFALVEGEPGIGKTRLVEALAAEAGQRGAFTVWGRCHEGDAAPALWPWIAALRALADLAPDSANTVVEHLLAPSSNAPASTTRFELFDGVAQMLTDASRSRALVLALDDLQWADPASLELLTFLSNRLADARVLVAGTVRELDVGRNDELVQALAALTRRPGSVRLQLRGLDRADTGQLLDQATGHPVADTVIAAIHERAEGNPFYATELARLLVEDAGLDDAAAVAAADVPAGVRDVVRRRLARLPDATNELLGIGAVIGRDVDLALLTHASGRGFDECLDDLEPAIVQRLLVMAPEQPSSLRFSHALVREVLVEGLSSLRRARLHLRVADALEATSAGADDVAEILAEHLWVASAVGAGQRAAEALERAAEVAVRRVALQSAEDLLTRAWQLRHSAGATPDAVRAELNVVARLNAITRARLGFAQSAETYRRGQELAKRVGRDDILHEMMWVEWGAADTACDFARGRPLAQYFRELGERSQDPFEQLLGFSVWGIQCWHDGRMTEACASLDAAAAIASWHSDAQPMGFEAEQRMFVTGFSLHMHDLVGDLDDVDERFEALIRRQPDPFSESIVCTQAIAGAAARGEWERAVRYGRRGMAADPDVVFTFWGSGLQMNLGSALMNIGHGDEGWPLFRDGRERYAQIGTRTSLGNYLSAAAVGLLRLGRIDEASDLIADARRELETYQEQWPEPVILVAEAELAHARGDHERAWRALDQAEAVATEQGSHGIVRRAQRTRERMHGS